jgi:hypothetical protein
MVAAPALSLAAAGQSAGPAANGSAGTDTGSDVGEAIPTSCEAVQANPSGSGPDYRVVSGSCEVAISDGDILSNVWFKGDGSEVKITARGSGWTIRNVAITNSGDPEDSALNVQVNVRDGLGLISNVWVSNSNGNGVFVHPNHAGEIRFRGFSCVELSEDCAYASRPGNPPSITRDDQKIRGQEGTVGFSQTFVKDVGHGPEVGYGIRLGSDGSFVANSTIVDTGGPAVANTFASGQNPQQHPDSFAGVHVRNVNIVQPDGSGAGVRLNNHQGRIKGQREWTAITTFSNVTIEAGEPVSKNLAGGTAPVIRGSYSTNDASQAPPPQAPHSPERAASGVGGGSGSIGSVIEGDDVPAGTESGGGSGGIIGSLVIPTVLLVMVVVLLVAALIAAILFGVFGALRP